MPTGSLTPVQRIMHARPRAVLRDQKIMARMVANVDSWPELTEQQRAEAIALLRPRQNW